MKNMRLFLIAILVVAGMAVDMCAQDRSGLIIEREVLPNKDTLLYQRWNGSWWFGGFGGFNGYANFGDLFLEYRRTFVDFSGGLGSGFHAGVMAEYNSPSSDLGFMLQASIIDRREANLNSTFQDTNARASLRASTAIQYFTITPSVRYKVPFFPNLFFFGGVDIELNTATLGRILVIDDTTARVVNERDAPFEANPFRVGVSFGAGIDILAMEFNRSRSRARITPYISFHFASAITSYNNSNWNLANARFGFALKLGENSTALDTLRRDEFAPDVTPVPLLAFQKPDYDEPAIVVRDTLLRSTVELAVVERAIIEEVLIPPPTKEPIEVAAEPSRTLQNRLPKFRTMARSSDEKEFLLFDERRSTLKPEARSLLDDFAEYLKENTTSRIALVGFTDNVEGGGPGGSQTLGAQRAVAIREYLVRKGVPAGRILEPGSQGANAPRADNRTTEGRRLNRRVEMILLP